MINLDTEYIILPVTIFYTIFALWGVIYVFGAMRFLKYPKFWRGNGIAFILSIITVWLMILFHALGILADWGIILLFPYIIFAPPAFYYSIKIRRKLRGRH